MTRIVTVLLFTGALFDASRALAGDAPSSAEPSRPSPTPTASASPVAIAPRAATPEYDAYRALVEAAPDMTFSVDLDEYADGRHSRVRQSNEYETPHRARCDIVDDRTRPERFSKIGDRVVWRGGSNVQVHPGLFFSSAVVVLDGSDPRVTDALGFGCGAWAPPEMLDRWRGGTIFESDGPTIDGTVTRRDVFVPPLTERSARFDTMSLDIDRSTHLPIRFTMYAAGIAVGTKTYCSVRLDVGLPNSDFSLTYHGLTAPPTHAPKVASFRSCE